MSRCRIELSVLSRGAAFLNVCVFVLFAFAFGLQCSNKTRVLDQNGLFGPFGLADAQKILVWRANSFPILVGLSVLLLVCFFLLVSLVVLLFRSATSVLPLSFLSCC